MDALWNLRRLLQRLEKGYHHDISLYTSGHLNPNNLYRPPEKIVHHWRNAHRPAVRRRAESPSEKKAAAMKDALAHFAIHTALRPSEAPGTPLFRYLHPQAGASHPSQEDVAPQPRGGAGGSPPQRRKEELTWPEVKVLKPKAARSSRQCVLAPPGRDEYRYVTSYLAGLTKADKYTKFLHFQRHVLAMQDLLESDFTGAQAALRHEKKLEQVRGAGRAGGTGAWLPGLLLRAEKHPPTPPYIPGQSVTAARSGEHHRDVDGDRQGRVRGGQAG